MNYKFRLTTALMLLCLSQSQANIKTKSNNGTTDERHTITALSHATIYVDATTILEDTTLLIQNEKIIGISKNNQVPKNAMVLDYTDLTIYPGFILMDSAIGMPEIPKKPIFQFFGKETLQSTKDGPYNSNEAIKASFNAVDKFHLDSKTNKSLREMGFTSALTYQPDGIMRGTSALINLRDDSDHKSVINSKASKHFSFDKGSSKQNYPISIMGSVALLRQTLMDSNWYPQQNKFVDLDLQAIRDNSNLPKIITTSNWQQTLLANKVAREFDIKFTVQTAGDSYQDISLVAASNQTLIVPLKFSEAPSINDPFDSWNIEFNDLLKWEASPFNPALLEQHKVNFAIIPADSKKGRKSFLKDLKKSVKHGLSKQTALKSLTSIPANILKNDQIGQLNKGSHANFIVTNGDIFSDDSFIAETWVAGQAYSVKGLPKFNQGDYQIKVADMTYDVKLTLAENKAKFTALDKESKAKFKITTDGDFLNIVIKDGDKTQQLFGLVKDKNISPLADKINWSVDRIGDSKSEQTETKVKTIPVIPKPFSAYGYATAEQHESILFKNATVWTNEESGILTKTDVLVNKGKIIKIGQKIQAKNAKIIDASGKHLTSGIIDEHAHIALLAVNDIAVNSSMVRMEDAVNSHDVNIYRNLAGGVTAAQLLHGSANPIGGQSALVKYKWGVSPEEMLIDGADGYIKFALGENVKRSRSNQSIRYPLTRMGVEQVYRDAFTQAKIYEKQWDEYTKLSKKARKKTTAPRKDLAMEATLEILNKERFVSCHSYVQSEINMLMHVAEDFDFNINTFTHILEGYKVADKMKQHGVGASTFSDWWAFKWEVNYAIPYNASLMTQAGVVTAINSDSAEMSRRLNQEAAKSIKYGGLSEQQAWKMITLNPAKLLHLDEEMGSIKPGKDADLVLWSDNPLSIYAKVEKTLIDGVIYYDRSKQADIEAKIRLEKQRLIKLAQSKDKKKNTFKSAPDKTFQCDSMTGYEYLGLSIMSGEIQ